MRFPAYVYQHISAYLMHIGAAEYHEIYVYDSGTLMCIYRYLIQLVLLNFDEEVNLRQELFG